MLIQTLTRVPAAVAAAAVLFVALAVAPPASAQDQCKPSVKAVGAAALTMEGAKRKAIRNWQRAVIAQYGEFFGNFDKARDASVAPCGRTLIGLSRCEARGRPCLTEQTAEPGEIPEIDCKRRDSRNCLPAIKWLQTRLDGIGCSPGKIDGADGPNTNSAVRCAQRKFRQEESGEVTAALVDQLKK